MTDKKCVRCQQVKPVEEFGRYGRSDDGYQSWCRSCFREYQRTRQQSIAERAGRLMVRRPERTITQQELADWIAEGRTQEEIGRLFAERMGRSEPYRKETVRQWARKFGMDVWKRIPRPERPKGRAYPEKTIRTCMTCGAEIVRSNKHGSRRPSAFCSRECYYKSLKGRRHGPLKDLPAEEAKRLNNRKYRHQRVARKKGNGGKYTSVQWLRLVQACNGRCVSCGNKASLTADHIVPLEKGGTSRITNIQPLCHSCNSSKGNSIRDMRPVRVKKMFTPTQHFFVME